MTIKSVCSSGLISPLLDPGVDSEKGSNKIETKIKTVIHEYIIWIVWLEISFCLDMIKVIIPIIDTHISIGPALLPHTADIL